MPRRHAQEGERAPLLGPAGDGHVSLQDEDAGAAAEVAPPAGSLSREGPHLPAKGEVTFGREILDIVGLAAPIFVSMVSWIGMKTTDTALVGHVSYEGDDAHYLEATSLR